jgi:hypothetical protein
VAAVAIITAATGTAAAVVGTVAARVVTVAVTADLGGRRAVAMEAAPAAVMVAEATAVAVTVAADRAAVDAGLPLTSARLRVAQ